MQQMGPAAENSYIALFEYKKFDADIYNEGEIYNDAVAQFSIVSNPSTLDNVKLYISIFILSILGFIGFVLYLRKNISNNN